MSRQLPKGGRNDWQTPPEVFTLLATAAGGFAVDAAANEANRLCDRWYGPGSPDGENALAVETWHLPAFVNPPYVGGESWRAWLAKMVKEGQRGLVVAIIPAAVGSRWWAEFVVPFADILFITGRLKFRLPGRQRSSPNHDSAVVIFSPNASGSIAWMNAPRSGVVAPPVGSTVEPTDQPADQTVPIDVDQTPNV